jgi:hypothetical protein
MSSRVTPPASMAPESGSCEGAVENWMSFRLVGAAPDGTRLVAAEPPDGLTGALVDGRRPSFAEIDTVMWSWCTSEETSCSVSGSSSR